MPLYQIQGPDGRTYRIEGPPGASREEIIEAIEDQLASKKPPEEGIIASGIGGAKRLLSSGQTAIESIFDPEGAARRGLERQKAIGEQYAPGANLEAVKRAYEEKGLLSAAGEVASQIPGAFAEQVPNIATTFGAARLGAMAGAPLGPVGALIGGGAGALTAIGAQLYGSGLERQAAEGAPEISRARALAAAAPGAALELAGQYIPLGRSIVGKILGPQAEKALAAGATKGNARLAEEGLARTLAKGTAVGTLAEIPTEVTQQMLERWQAGLPLTSDEAYAEYGEAAYSAGLVGAPFGAIGRAAQRSVARGEAAERAETERMEQVRIEREKEAAYKQTPEYRQELNAKIIELQDELRDVDPIAKDKTIDKDIRAEAKTRAKELESEIAKLKADLKSSVKSATEPEAPTTLQGVIERRKAIAPRAVVDEFGNIVQQGQALEVPMFDEQGRPVTYTDKEGNTKLRTFKAALRDQGLTEEAEAAGYQQQAQATQDKLQQLQQDIEKLRKTADAEEIARALAPQISELKFSVAEENKINAAIQKAKKENDTDLVEQLQSTKRLMGLARMGPIELQTLLRKNATKPDFLENLQKDLTQYDAALQPTIQQYADTLEAMEEQQRQYVEKQLKLAQQEQTQEGKISQIERLLENVGLRMAGVKSSVEGNRLPQLSESLGILNENLEKAQEALDAARSIKVPAKPLPEDVARFRGVLATSLPEDLLAPTKQQVEAAKAKAVAEAKAKVTEIEKQRNAAAALLNKARNSRQYIESLIDQGLVDINVARALGIPNVKAEVRPIEAANVLDKINTRIADLERARLNFAAKELITPEGKLTKDGNAFVNIEARLRELKRLQTIAEGRQLESRVAKGEAVTPAEQMVTSSLAQEPTAYTERAQQDANVMDDSFVSFFESIDDLRKGEYQGGRKEAPVTEAEMAAAQAKLDRETASGGSLVNVTRTLVDSKTGEKRRVKEKASTIDLARKELEDLKKRASRTGGIGGEGVSPKTEKQLLRTAQVSAVKYVNALINRINSTLAAQGRPALTENGEQQIRTALEKDFTELTKRIRGLTREEGLVDIVIPAKTIPAQMRGTKVVRGAEIAEPSRTVKVDTRTQLEKKFGSPGKAVAVILESIEEKTKNALALAEPRVRRVQTGYTAETYPRLGLRPTELESEASDVVQSIDALVETGRVTGELRQVLNDAADAVVRGEVSPDFIAELRDNVARIERGLTPSLLEIRDELRRIARPEGKRKEVVPKGQKFVEKDVTVQEDLFPAQIRAQKAAETKRGKATAVRPEYPGDLKQREIAIEEQLKLIKETLAKVSGSPIGLDLYTTALKNYKTSIQEIRRLRERIAKLEENIKDGLFVEESTEQLADLKKYLRNELRDALLYNKDIKELPIQHKELGVFLNLQKGLSQFQEAISAQSLKTLAKQPIRVTLEEQVQDQYNDVVKLLEKAADEYSDAANKRVDAYIDELSAKADEMWSAFVRAPAREAAAIDNKRQELLEQIDDLLQNSRNFFIAERNKLIYQDGRVKLEIKKLRELQAKLTKQSKGTPEQQALAKAAADKRAEVARAEGKIARLKEAVDKKRRQLEQRILSSVSGMSRVVRQEFQYAERQKAVITPEIQEAKAEIEKLKKQITKARREGKTEEVASLIAQKNSLQQEIKDLLKTANKTPVLMSERYVAADALARQKGEPGTSLFQKMERLTKQLRMGRKTLSAEQKQNIKEERDALKQQIDEAEKSNQVVIVPAIKRTITEFYSDAETDKLRSNYRSRAGKLNQLIKADEDSGYFNLSNSERRDYQKQYDELRLFITEKEPIELAAEYRKLQDELKQQLADLPPKEGAKEEVRKQHVFLETKIGDLEARIENMRAMEKKIEKSMSAFGYENRIKRLVAPFEKREEIVEKSPSVKQKATRAKQVEAEIKELEVELQELKQWGNTGKEAQMSKKDVDKRIKQISKELADKYVVVGELNTALEEFYNDMHMALTISERETAFPVYRHQRGTPRVKEGQLVTEPRSTTSKVVVHEQMMDLFPAAPFKKPTTFRMGRVAEKGIDVDKASAMMKGVEERAAKQNISVKTFKTIKDLPASLKQDIRSQGLDIYADQIKGGVMPDGTVFVVLENHKNMADLEKTLAHELVGHYTFEGILGPDGMRNLLKQVNNSFGDVFKLADILGVQTEASEAYAAGMQAGLSNEDAQLKALEEVVAYTMEKRVDQNFLAKAKRWMQEMVGALRKALRGMGFDVPFSTSDLFYLMKEANSAFMDGKPIAYKSPTGVVSLSSEKAKWGRSVSGGVVQTTQKIVASRIPFWQKFAGNMTGMNFRTQFVDAIDSLEKIKERGLKGGLLSAVQAVDLTYFYRAYAQRMSFVSQAATNGVSFLTKVKRPDGQYEYMITRENLKDAASLKKTSQALSKAGYGNAKANGDFFTAYMACERSLSVGKHKLDYTKNLTDTEIAEIIADGRNNKAIQEARKTYNDYNKDLLTFLEQTGAISKKQLADLLRFQDYIPYYREAGDGVVSLWIDNEKIMKIGSTVEQPHLKELIGDNKPILDFFISSLQNTNMIMDMALRNLSTRNVAFTLEHLGIAKRVSKKVAGSTKNIIRAKIDGEEVAWSIDTSREGVDPIFGDIPADIVVKGLDGIKTALPGIFRVLSVPSDIFRKFITRNPIYAARQVVRDSTAAYLATGSDALPVLAALKELYGMSTGESKIAEQLAASGGLGGQVITGKPEDMQKILLQLASGKPGWELLMAKLDGLAMAGDAATRVTAYKSFIRQGMSQREATLASLEIMNFSRRGASPSMLWLNSVIPFLSANIQGLDVTYRSMAGKMMGSKALNIRRKMVMRGLMITAATVAYAIGMEDDEAYKNAKGVDRYSNWFVRVPGLEEPIRIPIPFELGYIFKALPEAAVNAARKDPIGETVISDMFKMFMRSVPGDLPLAAKPLIEVATNHSFFNDMPVVSKRLEGLDAKYQVNNKTPEVLRLLSYAGLSPVQAEHLVRGYTGSVGLAFLSMLNPLARPVSPNKIVPGAEPRLSELPLLGSAFQPNDATGMIEYAFNTVETARRASNTYKMLVKEGRAEEAKAFFNESAERIAMASPAGLFIQQMGALSTFERQVKASEKLSEDKKREQIDKIKQQRIKLSENLYKQKQAIAEQIKRRTERPNALQ